MSNKENLLSGFSARAWNNVAKASLPQSVEWFTRDTEVMQSCQKSERGSISMICCRK